MNANEREKANEKNMYSRFIYLRLLACIYEKIVLAKLLQKFKIVLKKQT